MTADAGESDAAFFGGTKRVAPRSPRAALEPEYMPEPKRPSRRARHPLIIAGIRRALEDQEDIEIAGEALSASEVMQLVERRQPL